MLHRLLTSSARTSFRTRFNKSGIANVSNELRADQRLLNVEIRRLDYPKSNSSALKISGKSESVDSLWETIMRVSETRYLTIRNSITRHGPYKGSIANEFKRFFSRQGTTRDYILTPKLKNFLLSKSDEGSGSNTSGKFIIFSMIASYAIGVIILGLLSQPSQPTSQPVQSPDGKSYSISNRVEAEFILLSFVSDDFDKTHEKLKAHGIRVDRSFRNRDLWRFSYTLYRPTADEAIEADKEMRKIIKKEIGALHRKEWKVAFNIAIHEFTLKYFK